MSFYGNSYTYLADTFARIVMFNVSDPEEKLSFPTVLNTNPINIDAKTKDTSIEISSGNQWIGLQPKPENAGSDIDAIGFKIFHGQPNSQSDTFIEPFGVVKNEPEEIDDIAIKLNFDQYLQVPDVYYDEAGHISKTGQVTFYKMPGNPNSEVLGRMNEIDGKDNNPDKSSLKYELESRMNSIDGTNGLIDQLEQSVNEVTSMEDPNSLAYRLSEAVNKFDNMAAKVDALWKYVVDGDATATPPYNALWTEVNALKEKVFGGV